MDNANYLSIKAHYEGCLEKYGDSYLGVDWPNEADAQRRYGVMLDVVQLDAAQPVHLLDFGCGVSHLYEYIQKCNLQHIQYSGLDISEKFIALSRKKFPTIDYYCLDILKDAALLPVFDYMVMNGVFTEKRDLSYDEMFDFLRAVLCAAFAKVRVGLAFNVMSKQVDWERDDLFHVQFDPLARFLVQELSRHFVFRHNYRLYEYSVYVYK